MLNARVLLSRRTRATSSLGGGGTGVINLIPATYTSNVSNGLPAYIQIGMDGNVTGNATADPESALSYAWLLTGLASQFQVYCDVLSGSLSTGSSPTRRWLSVTNVDRIWKKTNAFGTGAVSLRLHFRRSTTFQVVGSMDVSLVYEGAEE